MIFDLDEDGDIFFEEFLKIIKSGSNVDPNSQTAKINKFFKDMSNGNLGSTSRDKDLSFNVIVQNIRRQTMMNAFFGNQDEKAQGMTILNNVARQNLQQKIVEK